jgi:hypothetical protein
MYGRLFGVGGLNETSGEITKRFRLAYVLHPPNLEPSNAGRMPKGGGRHWSRVQVVSDRWQVSSGHGVAS